MASAEGMYTVFCVSYQLGMANIYFQFGSFKKNEMPSHKEQEFFGKITGFMYQKPLCFI